MKRHQRGGAADNSDRRTRIVTRQSAGADVVDPVVEIGWDDHLDCQCGNCHAAMAKLWAERLGGLALPLPPTPDGRVHRSPGRAAGCWRR
jgi:hypothetical protein